MRLCREFDQNCILGMTRPFSTPAQQVPEMGEIVGGINRLSRSKDQSRRASIDEIKKFDPDKIVLMQ